MTACLQGVERGGLCQPHDALSSPPAWIPWRRDHASADYSGGAIFAALMPEPIVIEDSVFVSNEAGRLGGKCSSSLCVFLK